MPVCIPLCPRVPSSLATNCPPNQQDVTRCHCTIIVVVPNIFLVHLHHKKLVKLLYTMMENNHPPWKIFWKSYLKYYYSEQIAHLESKTSQLRLWFSDCKREKALIVENGAICRSPITKVDFVSCLFRMFHQQRMVEI